MRQTMPKREFMQWLSYLHFKQPDIQEQQMAVLTTVAANAMGGKKKVTDFIISKPKRNTVTHSSGAQVMSADSIRGVFGSVAKKAE